jgi:hypothetical protein
MAASTCDKNIFLSGEQRRRVRKWFRAAPCTVQVGVHTCHPGLSQIPDTNHMLLVHALCPSSKETSADLSRAKLQRRPLKPEYKNFGAFFLNKFSLIA